jgi:hypothetical protein
VRAILRRNHGIVIAAPTRAFDFHYGIQHLWPQLGQFAKAVTFLRQQREKRRTRA